MPFFKKNKEQANHVSENTDQQPKKKSLFGRAIRPVGSKSNRDFAKNLLVPKESRGFLKKVKEFFIEIKFRCRAPHTFVSYEDWEKYMGIEGAEEKDVRKAIKLTLFHPAIIILAVFLGTVFFSDIVWFNFLIYLSTLIFFVLVIPTYFWWNWIYNNKKYITLKEFLTGKKSVQE